MHLKKAIILMLLIVLILGALFFSRYIQQYLSQSFKYDVVEIQRMLLLDNKTIVVQQHAEPDFSPSLDYSWPDEPNSVMFKIWFTEKSDGVLVMDVYLTADYKEAIEQNHAGAKRFINSGIINAYIASMLDIQNYSLNSFCNSDCTLEDFNTIQKLK